MLGKGDLDSDPDAFFSYSDWTSIDPFFFFPQVVPPTLQKSHSMQVRSSEVSTYVPKYL